MDFFDNESWNEIRIYLSSQVYPIFLLSKIKKIENKVQIKELTNFV